MIRSFADETTRDLFESNNTMPARRIRRTVWPAAQRKLKQLDLAQRLDEMAIPPSNHLEALKGDRAGLHSVRVNKQYRVTFRWEQGHAYDVCCEDYH